MLVGHNVFWIEIGKDNEIYVVAFICHPACPIYCTSLPLDRLKSGVQEIALL